MTHKTLILWSMWFRIGDRNQGIQSRNATCLRYTSHFFQKISLVLADGCLRTNYMFLISRTCAFFNECAVPGMQEHLAVVAIDAQHSRHIAILLKVEGVITVKLDWISGGSCARQIFASRYFWAYSMACSGVTVIPVEISVGVVLFQPLIISRSHHAIVACPS